LRTGATRVPVRRTHPRATFRRPNGRLFFARRSEGDTNSIERHNGQVA